MSFTDVNPEAGHRNGSKHQTKLVEIIDISARLFMERGYEQTSMQDIADAVGILKGSLYYYIRAKEDILYEAIRRNHEGLNTSMAAALADGELSPMESVHRFLDNHINFALDNYGKSTSFYFEFRSLGATRQSEILGLRRAYEQQLSNLLAVAQQEGSVCPDLNPALAARAVLSMLNSPHRWYRPGGRFRREDVIAHYVQISLRGIACSPETHVVRHNGTMTDAPNRREGAQMSPGSSH